MGYIRYGNNNRTSSAWEPRSSFPNSSHVDLLSRYALATISVKCLRGLYEILPQMSHDNLCPWKPIKYPTLNHCLNVYRQLHMKLTGRTRKPSPFRINRIHLILIRPLSSVPTLEREYLWVKVHRNLELLNSFPKWVKVRGIVKENPISVFTGSLPVI